MQNLQEALQDAILTRSAMNGDIDIVESAFLSFLLKGEVMHSHTSSGTIVQEHLPVGTLHLYYIDIIAFFVEKRIKTLSRAKRDIVLRRVATTDDGNCAFHLLHSVFYIFSFNS